MKQSILKELKKELSSHYASDSSLDFKVKEFLLLIEDFDIIWFPFEKDIYFSASSLAQALGKHRSDFAANWVNKNLVTTLVGSYRSFNKEEFVEVKSFIKRLFDKPRVLPNSWYLNWAMAYNYTLKSNKAIKSIGKLNPGSDVEVVIEKDKLFINSEVIAKKLKVSHKHVIELIKKFSESLQQLGSLNLNNNNIQRIFLNEDQAYLIGTLVPNNNTAIEFKYWLVSQLSRARKVINATEAAVDLEDKIHKQLAHLSLYTSLKVNCEYPIQVVSYENNITKKTVRRLDLLIDMKIGIELKNEKITSRHINDIIGNRGYFHELKKLESFKYLIISSNKGITHNAIKILEITHPKVIFLYPYQIGDRFAELILKEYPKSAHWWVRQILLPKFSDVISKDLLQDKS